MNDVKVSAANARVGNFDQNLVPSGDYRPGDFSKRQLLGAIIKLQGGVRRTHNYSLLVAWASAEEKRKFVYLAFI